VLGPSGSSSAITGITLNVQGVASLGVFVPAGPESRGHILDSFDLIGLEGPIRLLGVRASTGRGASFSCVGSARRFPPRGCRLFPLQGWRVSAEAIDHGGFQIVIGLSIEAAGTGHYLGVGLTYHDADGRVFRAVFAQGGILCAPKDEFFTTGCPNLDEVARSQQALLEG
jgi:hypothetical protein